MKEQTRRQFLKTAGLGALALATSGPMAFAGSGNYIRRMIENAKKEGIIGGDIYTAPPGMSFEEYVNQIDKSEFNKRFTLISPKARTIAHLSTWLPGKDGADCKNKARLQGEFIRDIYSIDSKAHIFCKVGEKEKNWYRDEVDDIVQRMHYFSNCYPE